MEAQLKDVKVQLLDYEQYIQIIEIKLAKYELGVSSVETLSLYDSKVERGLGSNKSGNGIEGRVR